VLQRLRRIWAEARPVEPTDLVFRYLRDTRGLKLSQFPKTLRLHPSLPHRWSDTSWPAMLAIVQRSDGESVALHRTWLDPETVNKAPVTPQRAMLGPQQNGAIRLFEHHASRELLVAEGIETALTAGELDHWKRSVWAAISTSGLMALQVPKKFGAVVIAADNDANGAGVHAANVLARRLRKRGVRVRIFPPRRAGADWNDELLEKKQQGPAA
jgi:hypothetical protein